MPILIAGTSLVDFPDSFPGAGPTVDNTNPIWFDDAYVSRGIEVSGAANSGAVAYHCGGPVDDLWVHCVLRTQDTTAGTSATESTRLGFYDEDNNVVAEMSRWLSNSVRLRAYGGSIANSAGVLPSTYAGSTPFRFSARVQVTETTVTITTYVNGGAVDTVTATTATKRKSPVRFELRQPYSNNSRTVVFSEIIVTDGVDPRDMRVKEAALNPAAGHYDQMSGARADLTDHDETTFMRANAVGQRVSLGSAFPAFVGTPAVRGLVINSRAGYESGPANALAGFVRRAGTDFDAPFQTVTARDRKTFVMENDPGTSAPWDPAGLDDIEIGILAGAA